MMIRMLSLALILSASLPLAASAQTASCTALSADLSRGSSGASVLLLQNYLKSAGYLAATPNGNFGPSTEAAVKSFQSANSIPSTGTVGPITRLAIQLKSCAAPSPASPSESSQPQSGQATTSAIETARGKVTAPRAGDTLSLTKTFTVRWTGASTNQSLILEDAEGVTKGTVAYFLGNDNRITWEVGKVSVSGESSEVLVAPGSYRIRLQDRTKGQQGSDPKSALFTIAGPTLSATSLSPAIAKNDGKSSAVLHGSGFVPGTRLYLDGAYNKPLTILYTSPDARIIVFSVPSDISPGTYQVMVKSEYGTVWNPSTLTVAGS